MCDNSCYLSSWQLQSDKVKEEKEEKKSTLKTVLIAGLVSVGFGAIVYFATKSVKAAVTSALLPGI